jgi:hypothetical protein
MKAFYATVMTAIRRVAQYGRMAAPEACTDRRAEDLEHGNEHTLVDTTVPIEDQLLADTTVMPLISEGNPVCIDESMQVHDNDMVQVEATAPEPRLPLPLCQDPTPGSMQWWATHQWLRFDTEFICTRCDRIWPEPRQDSADE